MMRKSALIVLFSRALLRHAAHACPPARANWIAAAASELDSITGAHESLAWSVGAVRASYRERLRAMSLHEPQLPRLVLLLEVLTCFLPSSLLWACVMAAAMRDTLPLRDSLYLCSAASIGPVGLLFFGQVAIGIPSPHGRRRSLTLTSLAGWTAVVVLLSPLTPLLLEEMPWRDCVLLVLLPVIGAAHYAVLESKSRSPQHPLPSVTS